MQLQKQSMCRILWGGEGWGRGTSIPIPWDNPLIPKWISFNLGQAQREKGGGNEGRKGVRILVHMNPAGNCSLLLLFHLPSTNLPNSSLSRPHYTHLTPVTCLPALTELASFPPFSAVLPGWPPTMCCKCRNKSFYDSGRVFCCHNEQCSPS